MSRVKLSAWIPSAIQRLTANSTAVAVSSTTIQPTRLLMISVETNAVRMRFDSTAPTTNTGILIQKDQQPFIYEGYNGAPLKFVVDAGGTAFVTVAGFTLPNS